MEKGLARQDDDTHAASTTSNFAARSITPVRRWLRQSVPIRLRAWPGAGSGSREVRELGESARSINAIMPYGTLFIAELARQVVSCRRFRCARPKADSRSTSQY